jgi:hypothetical protein
VEEREWDGAFPLEALREVAHGVGALGKVVRVDEADEG